MALPAGVTFVTNIKGDKGDTGDTGNFNRIDVEMIPLTDPPFGEVEGPPEDRGAKLHIPSAWRLSTMPVPGWKELVVTQDGWVLEAVRDNGSQYRFMDAANPARTAEPRPVQGARNVVLDQTETFVLEADMVDGSKYIHRLTVGSIDGPSTREAAVAMYGDSMTDLHDDRVQDALGLPVFNGGISGETSTEAAFRSGALALWGAVTGLSIPTSGSVAVTITTPVGEWKTGVARSFPVTVALPGGVSVTGTLTKSTAEAWTFAATGLSSPVTTPAEVRFVSAGSYPGRAIIFRAGRNNLDVDAIARDYRIVRDWVYATQERPRFLALPVFNSSVEPSGSSGYTRIEQINDAIADICGADFYDLRRWMLANGLAAAGITPTSQDTTDLAAGVIPTSLRADTTHLNAAGLDVEAAQIAYVAESKGWFTS